MKKINSLTLVLFLTGFFFSIFRHHAGFAQTQEFQWRTVEQVRKDSYQTLNEILKNLPEWDGIYVVTKTGYVEVSTHMHFKKIPVPLDEILGFLVKGKDYVEAFDFAITDQFTSQTSVYGGPLSYRPVPDWSIRKKAVGHDAYFFTFTSDVFDIIKKGKYPYICVYLNQERTKKKGIWFIEVSEPEDTSSFGRTRK